MQQATPRDLRPSPPHGIVDERNNVAETGARGPHSPDGGHDATVDTILKSQLGLGVPPAALRVHVPSLKQISTHGHNLG